MFDKLKAMGAVASLLKDKERLRASADRIKEHAERLRVEGQAGAGAVRVTVNGKMKVLSVEMQPALVSGMAADDRTRALAGSLIADAVNDALGQAQAAMRDAIKREAEALGLPDIPGDLGGLLT